MEWGLKARCSDKEESLFKSSHHEAPLIKNCIDFSLFPSLLNDRHWSSTPIVSPVDSLSSETKGIYTALSAKLLQIKKCFILVMAFA